jgi:superfamily II DNA or RNA helicase
MAHACPSMPRSQIDWDGIVGNPLLAQHRRYDRDQLRQEVLRALPSLNAEQRIAYDTIVAAFRDGRGGVYFIHGPGGTGKTFLYNLIAKTIRASGQVVFCSASSGVAAILLHDGATAHSTFKIPLQICT